MKGWGRKTAPVVSRLIHSIYTLDKNLHKRFLFVPSVQRRVVDFSLCESKRAFPISPPSASSQPCTNLSSYHVRTKLAYRSIFFLPLTPSYHVYTGTLRAGYLSSRQAKRLFFLSPGSRGLPRTPSCTRHRLPTDRPSHTHLHHVGGGLSRLDCAVRLGLACLDGNRAWHPHHVAISSHLGRSTETHNHSYLRYEGRRAVVRRFHAGWGPLSSKKKEGQRDKKKRGASHAAHVYF